MKIIKGDQVKIIAGKDKGRSGEVIRVFPNKSTIIIKGLNLFKKHLRPSQNQKGSIIEKERPLIASKATVICPSCHKTTRVKYQVDKTGHKYRICHHCQALLSLNNTSAKSRSASGGK